MRTQFLSLVALTLGVTGAATAQQSTIVVGQSAAASCYQNAVHGRGDQMALRDCDTAISNHRTSRMDRKKSYVNRAVILLRMNRPEQALADLEAATRLRFEAPEVYLNYSAAYIRLGQNREAITAATQAIELGFERPQQAYFNRAIAQENIGNLEAALADFERAAELAPDWAAPRRELERFSINTGS